MKNWFIRLFNPTEGKLGSDNPPRIRKSEGVHPACMACMNEVAEKKRRHTMTNLKRKMSLLDPTHVKFHLNRETLKEMVKQYVYNKTGKLIIKDLDAEFGAVEDTGRVTLDYDALSTEEEQAFEQAGLVSTCDDDLAEFIERVVGEYFGASVSVYCTGIDEGLWVIDDFDVLMDYETFIGKRGAA